MTSLGGAGQLPSQRGEHDQRVAEPWGQPWLLLLRAGAALHPGRPSAVFLGASSEPWAPWEGGVVIQLSLSSCEEPPHR